MKGIIIVLLLALFMLTVSSIQTINKNENETIISFQSESILQQGVYYYKFPLLTDANEECDLHWLRMQVYYYCGVLPDALTKADPHLFVGFYNELTPIQEKCLNQVMSSKDVCFEPKGIKCRAYTKITPQALESKTVNATGLKPLYYSDGNTVWIILFDELTPTKETEFKSMLVNMWTIECEK